MDFSTKMKIQRAAELQATVDAAKHKGVKKRYWSALRDEVIAIQQEVVNGQVRTFDLDHMKELVKSEEDLIDRIKGRK